MSKVKTAEEFYREVRDNKTLAELMRAYASHVLEVAAERAIVLKPWGEPYYYIVDKDSILDIKKEL